MERDSSNAKQDYAGKYSVDGTRTLEGVLGGPEVFQKLMSANDFVRSQVPAANARESFVPLEKEEDYVLGPYSVIANKNIRYPSFAITDTKRITSTAKVTSIQAARTLTGTIINSAGMLHPFIDFEINETEKYTVTGIYVTDREVIEFLQKREVQYTDTNRLDAIEGYLHFAIIFELMETYADKIKFDERSRKAIHTWLQHSPEKDSPISSRDTFAVFAQFRRSVMKYLWSLGEDAFVRDVRASAQELTLKHITQAHKLIKTAAMEAARKERPKGSMKEGVRRKDVFESGVEGIGKLWADSYNKTRVFHLIPEQEFDLDFGAHILQGRPPYDFKQLMMPFDLFAIRFDGGWVAMDEDHPDRFSRVIGYIVNGSYETGIWYFHRKHEVRNNERDLEAYVSVRMDQNKGTTNVIYTPLPKSHVEYKNNAKIQADTEALALQMTRFIVNFLLVLNHRSVKVVAYGEGEEPGRPETRQQRRAMGYVEKRDHYKIYIPAKSTLTRYADEVVKGINVKERRPHDVRGHLRTDQYGRKRIRVKPHKRCKDSSKPYFLADYDAANVGIEEIE